MRVILLPGIEYGLLGFTAPVDAERAGAWGNGGASTSDADGKLTAISSSVFFVQVEPDWEK
jgi:hypothetical protein